MSSQNRIAIVVLEPKMNPDGTKGAYFPEIYRSWKNYTAGGFEVHLISESGTFTWDANSIRPNGPGNPTLEELAVLENPDHPFNKFTSEIKCVDDVSSQDYGALLTAGGENTCVGCEEVYPQLYKFFMGIRDQGGLVSFSFQDLQYMPTCSD